MKLTTTHIRKLIMEELVAATTPKTRLSKYSVDDQIDGLLITFEDEAKTTAEPAAPAQESRIRTLAQLMFEAPDDEDEDEEDEPGEVPPPDDDEESGEAKPTSLGPDEREEEVSAEPMQPNIEMHEFVTRVVRLLTHYDSLLDIPTVIVQRAQNFIEENYDETALQEFKDILEQDHGVSLTPKDNTTETPAAIGAGPGGA